MLKACPRCGRIHRSPEECTKKRKRKYYDKDTEESRIRSTQAWKRTRAAARERDHGMCLLCFAELNIIDTKELEVHHIVSIKEDPSLAFDIENTVLLCRQHHAYIEKLPPVAQKAILQKARHRQSESPLATYPRNEGKNEAQNME